MDYSDLMGLTLLGVSLKVLARSQSTIQLGKKETTQNKVLFLPYQMSRGGEEDNNFLTTTFANSSVGVESSC